MTNTIEQNTNCPPRQSLELLLQDTAKIDRDVVTHVDTCPKCQSRLDQLTDSGKLQTYGETVRQRQRDTQTFSPAIREGDLGAIGHFAIEERIGSGGSGVVYRAWDSQLERNVAIKLLNAFNSQTAKARFERETRAASKLNHPNIVPIHSSGVANDGRPYLVMPMIAGPTLKQTVQTGDLSFDQSAELIGQIANGLHVAHENGLVHRDVKPANILLDGDQAKLVDFGLVRAVDDQTLTRTELICGTPEYMAPESVDSNQSPDKLQDIYGLGISLYECLTGNVPFQGNPLDVLAQHREQDPLPPTRINRSIPRDLETICLKALQKDPDRRYGSAESFAKDLANYLDGEPILARPTTQLEKVFRWTKRNRALATSLAVLFGVLLASTVISTVLWRNSENNAQLAKKTNESLQSSLNMLRGNQQQLGAALRSTYLESQQQTEFMNLPIEVRNTILMELVRTWRLLSQRTQDTAELNEMANELLQVGEFTLENAMRSRSDEVTGLNQEIVDQLLKLSIVPSFSDLICAANAYNQRADSLLLNRKDASTELDYASSLSQQVMEKTDTPESNVDYQLASIASIETRRLQIKIEQKDRTAKADSIKDLLHELSMSNKVDQTQFKWWKLEQQLLSDMAKAATSNDVIDYRNLRNEVLDQIVRWHDKQDLISSWFIRKQAVNTIFLGVNYQSLGNSNAAVESWQKADHTFKELVVSNPLNPQFRADKMELSLIIANHDWGNGEKRLAIPSQEKVLKHVKDTIHVAANDHQLLRRGGQVCQLIGSRFLELSESRKAAETFRQGAQYAESAYVRRSRTPGADSKPERDLTINLLRKAAAIYEDEGMLEDKESVLLSLAEFTAEVEKRENHSN